MKTKTYILLILVLTAGTCTVDSLRFIYPRRCTASSQCRYPKDSCCRTSTGIVDRQEGPDDLKQGTSGTCGRLSKLGEECIPGSCGCVKGTTCYRPMQGVCCPVFACYDAKWVKEREEFWKRCFRGEIKCVLPQ